MASETRAKTRPFAAAGRAGRFCAVRNRSASEASGPGSGEVEARPDPKHLCLRSSERDLNSNRSSQHCGACSKSSRFEASSWSSLRAKNVRTTAPPPSLAFLSEAAAPRISSRLLWGHGSGGGPRLLRSHSHGLATDSPTRTRHSFSRGPIRRPRHRDRPPLSPLSRLGGAWPPAAHRGARRGSRRCP